MIDRVKAKKLKRSDKIALWAAVWGLVAGVPLTLFTGPLGIIIGLLVAGGYYQVSIKQAALERAVDGELLDK
jgi:hypothetical protein